MIPPSMPCAQSPPHRTNYQIKDVTCLVAENFKVLVCWIVSIAKWKWRRGVVGKANPSFHPHFINHYQPPSIAHYALEDMQ